MRIMDVPGRANTGVTAVRCAIALAAGGSWSAARELARRQWGEDSPAHRAVKAAVAGSIQDGNWGQPLAGDYAVAMVEFFELVRAASVLGKLPNQRRVPFNVPSVAMITGSSAAWRGEGRARSITMPSFDRAALDALGVSATVAVTTELLKNASLTVESILKNDMVQAAAAALDAALLDPENVGISGVKPASLTQGLDIIEGTGDLRADLAALLEQFPGDIASTVIVARPSTLVKIGGVDHPNVGARGGTLCGLPTLASTACPYFGEGSAETDALVVIDGSGLAVADQGAPMLSLAKDATIEMEAATSNDSITPTPTQTVSLWQVGAVGLAVDLPANWRIARPNSVAVMTVQFDS